MWKDIVVAFFALNAIFWGLFPHDAHCKVASVFTNACAPHTVHVGFGVASFLIAVIIAQQKMFRSVFA